MLAIVDSIVASFPSPSDGSLDIGPLKLRAYGLMIAIGVIVAVRWAGRRFEVAGIGDADLASGMALWAVPAGVIGARIYHVATDWQRFSDEPGDIVKIWEGGLGIPGGILLGTIVAVVVARRRNVAVAPMLWAAAPAIPVAQAIGRLGNWFNQELFGRPTTLPWGLEIDADKVAAGGFEAGTLFHPTFLYESLWNLTLAFVLVRIGDRFLARFPGRLLALYCVGYGIGRFWIEGLRIDAAKEGGGLRLNQWMAVVLVVGGVGYFVWCRYRRVASTDGSSDVGDGEVPSSA